MLNLLEDASQPFNMKEVAAYVLCVLGGNKSPSADDVKAVLSSVEAEADDSAVDALVKNMEGKDIDQVLLDGKTKLATVSVGGGGGGGGGGDAAAEEEKKEEEEEEEIDMGGGDMFGGDDDDY